VNRTFFITRYLRYFLANRLYPFERRTVAGSTGAAIVSADSTVIRTYDLLRFTAPNVIGSVDEVFRAGGESIEHEVLLGTESTAEWRLNWGGF
jgi:hypothetical protein